MNWRIFDFATASNSGVGVQLLSEGPPSPILASEDRSTRNDQRNITYKVYKRWASYSI